MGNKSMEKITRALVERENLTMSSSNMKTGESGRRYEVTSEGVVLYWGSKVAHLRYDGDRRRWALDFSLCGWNTPTTRKVINAAIEALEKLEGCPGYRPDLYQSAYLCYAGWRYIDPAETYRLRSDGFGWMLELVTQSDAQSLTNQARL